MGENFLEPMGKGPVVGKEAQKERPASLSSLKSSMIPVCRDSLHSSGIKVFFFLFDFKM